MVHRVKFVSYELAMNYLMNNKIIFEKIKNSFLSSYKNHKVDFKNILKQKNFSETERYIHSIKGISLNLGAKVLYDSCVAALEKIRKELWDPKSLKDFHIALRKTYCELDSLKDN